jgi:hypothetical protein
MSRCPQCGGEVYMGVTYHAYGCPLDENVQHIKAENQRLREALEFYADEAHYDGYVDYDYQWTGEAKQYDADIEGDRGEIARRALEGVEYD